MVVTDSLSLTLTNKQRQAVAASPGTVLARDTDSGQAFALVDPEWVRQARRALKAQEDWEAIKEGIEQSRRGEGLPLAEADRLMRQELGIPPRQAAGG